MKITSSQASKMLKKLNNDFNDLKNLESMSSTFLAAVGEDVESVRPEYSYAETRAKADELNARIRKLKHAINVFNSTTVIPEFGITIDEMLVYIPQLNAKLYKLGQMKAILPKQRQEIYGKSSTNLIDYKYANYEVSDAERDYSVTADTLARAQLALDYVNANVTFEFEY